MTSEEIQELSAELDAANENYIMAAQNLEIRTAERARAFDAYRIGLSRHIFEQQVSITDQQEIITQLQARKTVDPSQLEVLRQAREVLALLDGSAETPDMAAESLDSQDSPDTEDALGGGEAPPPSLDQEAVASIGGAPRGTGAIGEN